MTGTILSKINYLDESEVDSFLSRVLNTSTPLSLGFINQHGYNLMVEDDAVYDNFMSLDYVLRDGIGIELACKLKGFSPKANLNGTDLIPKLAKKALGLKGAKQFFVYGTQEPWLSDGTRALFSGADVSTLDGFQAPEIYQAHFTENHEPSGFNLVVLAMGMPKQELVADLLKAVCNGPLLVVCGGAIIDFQAGKTERAPEIWRKVHLEWFYRLLKEPRRMFNRYVIGIPKFFYYLVTQKK